MSHSDYCINLFKYQRYTTSEVEIGKLMMGGKFPIRVQSMTTTNTMDTKNTCHQAKRIVKAGGEMVRVTTQGKREASNLKEIKAGLDELGIHIPLVADIHFNPSAAEIAAEIVEKVRINPGNFADGAKKFESIEYTNETYFEELEEIKKRFIPFLNICKKNNTAIRIGTNHGSLSDRIMSRYGDTPMGMVESCLEFLRICKDENFHQIVLSIKASNARIMVQTVRLLVQKMKEEEMNYPLHLGVTEAGEGEDGRIRSSVGIGTLLIDGIGDTIRVSLTEEPEKEIPVAQSLIDYILEKNHHPDIKKVATDHYSPFKYIRRNSQKILNIGGQSQPIVIGNYGPNTSDQSPDYYYSDEVPSNKSSTPFIVPYIVWSNAKKSKKLSPLLSKDEFLNLSIPKQEAFFVEISYSQLQNELITKIKSTSNCILILRSENNNRVAEQRAAFLQLMNHNVSVPVIIKNAYNENSLSLFQLKASADAGPLLIDGFGDGIWLNNKSLDFKHEIISTSFSIVQAARVRFSKPDYISCPGCGRTLFELQETTAIIKKKTAHLKGLKIAIMGCIVNGPGEMADADYGYVGSGPRKVTLYHQRQIVKKNISSTEALKELILLIKANGDWHDPDIN